MAGFFAMFVAVITSLNIRIKKAVLQFRIPKKISQPALIRVYVSRQVGIKEATMNYPVVIHKDNDSHYGVTVPDLPGCFSAGETMEEALENAGEAILCHAEGLMMDEEPVPSPTSIEKHKSNELYKAGVWALVTVDMSKISGKAKRVNITVPERLLAQVDNYARKKGETRSGLFLTAAMEYISQHTT
jgi:predicted RNase H-like HicB family nuclease